MHNIMTKKEKRLKSCLEIKEKKNLVILIWGLGKTGQSLVDFFKKNTTHTINTLNSTKTEELINHHYHDDEWEKAIAECDYFIPSPGILLPQLAIESEKHIPEFDLFYVYWKEKIIAITGSVGKTSITSLINQQLENHFSTYLAGNIGIPLF